MTENRLLEALRIEQPLQIVGTINAYSSLLAQDAGFRALYLSGSGVASASFGLPDLAMTTLTEIVSETRRITSVTKLPLLVDVDTGFGDLLSIRRMIKEMINSGASGIHIEDQVINKRCGHRLGKTLVSQDEMATRISTAIDARGKENLLIMARTDALTVEGLESTVERVRAYVKAGAEAVFLEAARDLSDYSVISDAVNVPVLANMTEFGISPLFSISQLKAHGVAMILYPLTAFRAMSYSAQRVYRLLREKGTQCSFIDELQTRAEFYRIIDYEWYEQQIDNPREKNHNDSKMDRTRE